MEPREQRVQFNDALYRECSEAEINLRAIRKGGTTKSQFIPLGGDSIDQMETFVARYDTEQYIGVYYAVATRNGGGRKEHIAEIPALWIEIDFKNTPEEEARGKLGEFHFAPSAVISSGGGLHVYWFLKEPATKADIPEVEDALRRLVNALDAEPEATDASRILRIPGTYNRKKVYDTPREVKLTYCDSNKRYNLEDIADFLPEAPDYRPEPAPSTEYGTDIDRVMQCLFMQHCDEDRKTLPESEWYCMISNLGRYRGGPRKIHELSVGYPGYSREETNNKILHAIDAARPHTCNYIKRLWDCGKDCRVKAPAALAQKTRIEPVRFEPLTVNDTSIESFLNTVPPPREYYFDDLIPKRIIGSISARGGTSKSFLIITLGMGLATGKQVLNYFFPSSPTKVLLLFAEDPEEELHRRIQNTAYNLFPQMNDETNALLVENFHAKSVSGMIGGLMALHDGNPVLAPKYEWLAKTIEQHEGLELLFLDPKSRFYGLDENNNDHNTEWIQCLESLRTTYGVDTLFTHHVSKHLGDTLQQIAARGGGALIDGGRWAANLRTLSEKDGKRYSLDDYKRYVEFDVSKSNYAPMLPKSIFFKREDEGVLVPVNLGFDRLKRIAEGMCSLVFEQYRTDATTFTIRDLISGPKGKDIRQALEKELEIKTSRDERKNSLEYACKEDMATLMEDYPNKQRKILCVKNMMDMKPEKVL